MENCQGGICTNLAIACDINHRSAYSIKFLQSFIKKLKTTTLN